MQMKKNFLLGIATLSAALLLAGCGTKEVTPTEYCEQNGGVSQEGICLFEDGSYCAEDAYSKGECKEGDITFNVVDEKDIEEPAVEENEEIIEDVPTVEAEDIAADKEELLGSAVEEVNEEVIE